MRQSINAPKVGVILVIILRNIIFKGNIVPSHLYLFGTLLRQLTYIVCVSYSARICLSLRQCHDLEYLLYYIRQMSKD